MRNIKIIITLVLVSLVMAACTNVTEEPTTVPPITQPIGIVSEGRVSPINSLDHSFMINGKVEELLVQEGEAVTQGQVLVRLSESPEAALQLARAELELLSARKAREDLISVSSVNLAESKLAVLNAQEVLDQARDKYDDDQSEENQAALELAEARYQLAEKTLSNLGATNGVDPSQLDLIDARIVSAEQALASAQSLIESHELKATISGVVSNLQLQPGELVTAGRSILTIADTSSWVILTDNLTELDIPQVEIGQQVEVTLDALPDFPMTGQVTQIDSQYVEKRGDITYTVTILLEAPVDNLRWGMTAAVVFVP